MVCDVNPASPAVHLADRAFEVPYSDDPDYFDAVRAICVRHQIGLVVPTIDDEIPRFAAVRDRFDAIGIAVAASPLDTALAPAPTSGRPAAGWRRRASRRRRRGCRTSCPTSPRFPLFVKPRSGRGSVQAFPARDAVELAFFLRYVVGAGRPGVPRRPGVHARSALRLRRPPAVGRAARARRHPRRRHRPRPDRQRSAR